MNVISWNYRGTASKGFVSLVRDLRQQYDSNFIIMETHTSGDRASSIIKKLGFKGSFILEACGHSGGIWCLWKVDVVRSTAQFVHMKVQWKGDNPWLLTAVYGSPLLVHR